MSLRRWGFVAQLGAIAFALFAFAADAPARNDPKTVTTPAVVAFAELPAEARRTVALVRQGGPFAHERDGVVFGNFERLLPLHERGYYREYTVPTPGISHRGARRIVAGRGGELYYTDDHYRIFRRIRE
jgi:ribonuclease T1